jgi:hypothetical protein
VSITMRSSAFDSWLVLGRGTGGADFTFLESDDDSAGGRDARLTVTLGEPGEYVIRANSVSADATGAYSLTLEGVERASGGSSITADLPSISFGQTVSAQLTSGDRTLGDGSYYDGYRFQGRAGQQVTITLRSSAFDAFLSVARVVGDQLVDADSDDDSAGGTNARVTITLPTGGEYVIKANSLSAGSTGAYTLSLTSD